MSVPVHEFVDLCPQGLRVPDRIVIAQTQDTSAKNRWTLLIECRGEILYEAGYETRHAAREALNQYENGVVLW